MFPLSEELINLLVFRCKNLTKLHITNMKSLSDEARNDLAKLFIGTVKAGAQLKDIDITTFGVSREQGYEMIESCINHELKTITNLSM